MNQAKVQLVNNREAKHRLEMDWSDKVRLITKYLFRSMTINRCCISIDECIKYLICFQVTAGTLDSKNSALKNTRGNIMHRSGQSVYKEM